VNWSPLRLLAMLASFFLIAGCSGGGSDAPASNAPAHLPAVSDVGGPKMAHLQLVPIFFGDEPDVDTLTAFSQWIVTSGWFDAAGAEYGVGKGSVLGIVHKTTPAPDAISDTQIVDLIFQGLADGTLPQPASGGLGEVLYVFHFPAQTVVTSGSEQSCVDFGGYHASARRNGVELAYAVIVSCADFIPGLSLVEEREVAASHELIESATDPFPHNHPGIQLRDMASSWRAIGDEVGDLCEGGPAAVWHEAGFVAQRSWSNIAAAAGDPCVPATAAQPYYNVVAETKTVPRIAVGGHTTLTLDGWSSGATPDWRLSVSSAKAGDSTLKLGSTTLGAGKSTTLDIAVPASAAAGAALRLFVFSSSSQTAYQVLPLLAVAGAPCSTFNGCDACTAQAGCGFCATTGKCEAEGSSGSAESACPSSSFATWPGSCPGYCAGHGGSCGDCSSQVGCGWCASAGATRCLEASHLYSEPAGATCAYADWNFTPDYCPE
jgi:hypothetical protein